MVTTRVKWFAALLGGGLLSVVLIAEVASPVSLDGAARLVADTAEASVAIATLESRYHTDPRNYVLAGRLADRYMARFATGANLDDVMRAELIGRRLVAEAPNKTESHARLSQILLARHDFDGAFSEALSSIHSDSSKSVGWAVLFDAAMAVGNYDDAATALAMIRPKTLARRLRHARWLAFNGESETAYHKLADACKEIRLSRLRPQVAAWCLTELSGLALERDGTSTAKDLLELALSTQPEYRGALEQLAHLAVVQREWEKAAKLYEQIATDAHPDIYLRLAEVYGEIGDSIRAFQNEEKFVVIASQPHNETLYAHPLVLFMADSLRNLDLASQIIHRDLSRRQSVETYTIMAWVALLRGDVHGAYDVSMKARTLGSPSLTLDYVHGRILTGMGRKPEAAPLVERAVQNPALLEPYWAYRVQTIDE